MSPRRKQPIAASPKHVKGSVAARRAAALVLEALSGMRTTQEASDALGVALPRYYVLETRAIQGLVDALEPRARGRQRDRDRELKDLADDNARLRREVLRHQSLYRNAQRTLGVEAVEKVRATKKKKATATGKKTRKARRKARALRVIEVLKEEDPDNLRGSTSGGGRDGDGSSEQGSRSRGEPARSAGDQGAPAGGAGDHDR